MAVKVSTQQSLSSCQNDPRLMGRFHSPGQPLPVEGSEIPPVQLPPAERSLSAPVNGAYGSDVRAAAIFDLIMNQSRAQLNLLLTPMPEEAPAPVQIEPVYVRLQDDSDAMEAIKRIQREVLSAAPPPPRKPVEGDINISNDSMQRLLDVNSRWGHSYDSFEKWIEKDCSK